MLGTMWLFYMAALCLSVAMSLVLIGYIWPRRSAPGARPLMGLLLASAFWAGGYIIEYVTSDFSTIYAGIDVSYIGIVFLPVMLSLFAFRYTHNDSWLTPPIMAILFTIPVITLILQWTNSFHHLMYVSSYIATEGPFILVIKEYNTWFWIGAFFGYSLQIAGVSVLIYRMFKPPRLFLDQTVYLTISIVLPTLTSVLYLINLPYLPRVDWTPASFSISSVCLTLAITRAGFLDVLPVARESAIEHMNEGFMVLDEQERVVDINRAMNRIINSSPNSLQGLVLPKNIASQLGKNPDYVECREANIEITLDHGGETRFYSVHVSPLVKGKRSNTCSRVLVFYDITERKHVEEAIKQIAYYDPLTGLPNRSLFSDRAEIALGEATRYNRRLAVMIMDLDRFKEVNDKYGHGAGDQLLQDLAVRLTTVVRKVDTVCRLGGDEFMVLLPEISGEDIVDGVALRILNATAAPFMLGTSGDYITITISIGLAIYPEDGEELSQLIKSADAAMYSVKQRGHNGFARYSPGMSTQPDIPVA